jgi:hypothetical protein
VSAARGPKPPRSPENDIRLIANYCQRLDRILDRLSTEEIEALSTEDRQFVQSFAEPTSNMLGWVADVARDATFLETAIPMLEQVLEARRAERS